MPPRSAAGRLTARIRESTAGRAAPLLVAIDGRSGAGKSTLAAEVAALTGASVIDGDDFYAGGTAGEWDALTPRERAARCIDWRRQRDMLAALARGEPASWRPYDWQAGDDRFAEAELTCAPAQVVILDGAYSARPELADLLDLRVLLLVPDGLRREQLLHREGERYRAEWEARWAAAEEYYFAHVMPPASFDLVLRPGQE